MRERLNNRRASEVLNFDHTTSGGATIHYQATLGFYDDDRLGEVFLNGTKIGTDTDIAVRDAAILLSFALQHGCTVETIRSAVTRDAKGRPEGVIGTLLDLIAA